MAGAVVFPFLAWIAVATSATMLGMLWAGGQAGRLALTALLAWLLGAADCQFLGASDALTAVGLVLQTALAIYLLFRWKVGTL